MRGKQAFTKENKNEATNIAEEVIGFLDIKKLDNSKKCAVLALAYRICLNKKKRE